MVKDGEDYRIINDELVKVRSNFSRYASHDVASLTILYVVLVQIRSLIPGIDNVIRK